MKPRLRRGGLSVRTSLTVRLVPGMQVVLIALMLLGVGLVGFGVKILADTRRFLTTAEPAKGVVVRVDKRVRRERVGSGDNEHWANVTRYYPFVEFRTACGQVAQFQADDGSLRVGDSVNLVYEPANPPHARLDKWGNRWAGPLALWGAGLAILVMSGAVYLWYVHGRAAQGAPDGSRVPAVADYLVAGSVVNQTARPPTELLLQPSTGRQQGSGAEAGPSQRSNWKPSPPGRSHALWSLAVPSTCPKQQSTTVAKGQQR